MYMTKHGIGRAGLGAIAVVLGVGGLALGLGADSPPQTIDAGGLKFQAPAGWKSNPPSSSMRRAELKIGPTGGDKEPAELVVFAFPGGAGTVEANVQRWRSQFKDADGNPPRIESKVVKGKNVDVTRVETAGHYYPSQFPGRPKEPDRPNYRLLGAIVQTPETGYFVKMTGPDKTMQAVRGDFDQLIASMSVAGTVTDQADRPTRCPAAIEEASSDVGDHDRLCPLHTGESCRREVLRRVRAPARFGPARFGGRQ